MKLSQMVRTAILTANLDRSRTFYEQVLGMTDVYWQGHLNDPTVWHLLGTADNAQCRAVILKPPGQPDFGMVGLFEVSGPGPSALPEASNEIRVGEGVCVFYCSDLEYVVDRTETFGGRVVAAPINLVHEGRTKQREMCLRDPDGHAINLIEWDPAEVRRPELTPGEL
ncbi:MAG: VOC family protein [Pseudomonadota bacterium]